MVQSTQIYTFIIGLLYVCQEEHSKMFLYKDNESQRT